MTEIVDSEAITVALCDRPSAHCYMIAGRFAHIDTSSICTSRHHKTLAETSKPPILQLHPARGFACIVILSILISCFGLFFLSTSTPSILLNVANPSSPKTCPNTVFLPSRCGALSKQMKNWLPFVPGPLLAILTIPRALCRSDVLISSSNGSSHIEVPALGADRGAPVWIIKLGIKRWKAEEL